MVTSSQFTHRSLVAKMKKGPSQIIVVLGRSGSMADVQDTTISGFSEFISKQRQAAGEAMLMAGKFDDQYEPFYDGSLANMPPLDRSSFVPRGRRTGPPGWATGSQSPLLRLRHDQVHVTAYFRLRIRIPSDCRT
jgi:hypothetical protein